jgi:hypothetical protein
MTEDDKELLRLAAKAGDIEYHIDTLDGCDKFVCNGYVWNPLVKDGDNRRLQIELRLGLVPQDDGAWVCLTYNSEGEEVMLSADNCPNLAVVKAAAHIGRKIL